MWELWDADQGRRLARVDTLADAEALGEWLVTVAARAEPGAALSLEVRSPGGRVVAWR